MQDGVMRTVKVQLDNRSYQIEIGRGNLGCFEEAMKPYVGRRAAIVSNPSIWKHYGECVHQAVRSMGIIPTVCLIPSGERHKSWAQIGILLRKWAEAELDRGSVAIALGGGVVGDMTGFAASCYMRGIPYIQMPTTLLAQVDSSVGGKTGVDLPEGKNLAGAFHQPAAVIADMDTLSTLPKRQIRSGMAEVLKYGYIIDEKLSDQLRSAGAGLLKYDHQTLPDVVARCCELKSEVVQQDEREGGARAMLNFGHTLGHAVETLVGLGKLYHGEAVSIGMVFAALLGEELLITQTGTHKLIADDMRLFGLPVSIPSSLYDEEIMQQMMHDKKVSKGTVKFALIRSIGQIVLPITTVSPDVLLKVMKKHRLIYGDVVNR